MNNTNNKLNNNINKFKSVNKSTNINNIDNTHNIKNKLVATMENNIIKKNNIINNVKKSKIKIKLKKKKLTILQIKKKKFKKRLRFRKKFSKKAFFEFNNFNNDNNLYSFFRNVNQEFIGNLYYRSLGRNTFITLSIDDKLVFNKSIGSFEINEQDKAERIKKKMKRKVQNLFLFASYFNNIFYKFIIKKYRIKQLNIHFNCINEHIYPFTKDFFYKYNGKLINENYHYNGIMRFPTKKSWYDLFGVERKLYLFRDKKDIVENNKFKKNNNKFNKYYNKNNKQKTKEFTNYNYKNNKNNKLNNIIEYNNNKKVNKSISTIDNSKFKNNTNSDLRKSNKSSIEKIIDILKESVKTKKNNLNSYTKTQQSIIEMMERRIRQKKSKVKITNKDYNKYLKILSNSKKKYNINNLISKISNEKKFLKYYKSKLLFKYYYNKLYNLHNYKKKFDLKNKFKKKSKNVMKVVESKKLPVFGPVDLQQSYISKLVYDSLINEISFKIGNIYFYNNYPYNGCKNKKH